MTEEMVQAAERLVVEAQAYAAAVRQGAAVDRLLAGADDRYGTRAFVDRLWSQELRTRWNGVIDHAHRVNAQLGAHHG